jgi:hypothetical protein
MKGLLGDLNVKICMEDVFKLIIWNERLHEISNDNVETPVNFATFKNFTVKSTMFPHHNIHKYSRKSPDGKTNNQTDHILIVRQSSSSVLDF